MFFIKLMSDPLVIITACTEHTWMLHTHMCTWTQIMINYIKWIEFRILKAIYYSLHTPGLSVWGFT